MPHLKLAAFFIAIAALFAAFTCAGNEKPKQPVELGTVKWSRDLESSLVSAGKSGKPVFLLFQEVPG